VAAVLPASSCSIVLEARGIVKRFRRGPVIGPLSFRIRRGELFALIGPNGAGKTTTIRMVLGIYEPDEGEILVCGRRRRGARGYAAYVPEETAVYPRLTGWEHLLFYARLYVGSGQAREVAELAAELTGLGRDLERRVSNYSKGMRRRLLLGLALALETPLLVLDEPTSGLDVEAAVRVRRLIREAVSSGRGVLMSSHNMLEVERLADRVAFIARGRIVDTGPPARLMEKYGAADLEEAYVRAIERAGGG
jgi:ABC-2 type transport system ATP-binding protein